MVDQAFLGCLIDYFCQDAKTKVTNLSSSFISVVIKLTKLSSIDLSHFGYPLIEHLSLMLKDKLLQQNSNNS